MKGAYPPVETRSPGWIIFVSSSRIFRAPAVFARVFHALLALAAVSAGAAEAGAIDPRFTGLMYFANAGGVLEFDGARWRLYRVPGFNAVNTIACDAHGNVWFSPDQQVGLLAPDPQGELVPVSALEQLPAAERAIFPLGRCVATADGSSAKTAFRFKVIPGKEHLIRG